MKVLKGLALGLLNFLLLAISTANRPSASTDSVAGSGVITKAISIDCTKTDGS